MKCILFDFDGTLADSLPVLRRIFSRYLAGLGISLTDELFHRYNGPPFPVIFQDLVDRFGLTKDPRDLYEEYASLVLTTYNSVSPTAGAVVAVDFFRKLGFSVAVVTSNSRELAAEWLGRHGIRAEAVVGAEDTVRGKPHPDPYLAALNLLGCEAANAFAVEDTQTGATAAATAGIATFLLGGNEAAISLNDSRIFPISSLDDLVTLTSPKIQIIPLNPPVSRVEWQPWPALTKEDSARDVEKSWAETLASNPSSFNGPTAIFRRATGGAIFAAPSDYRTWNFHRKQQTSLSSQVRALAVSCICRSGGKFLLGKRNQKVLLEKGCWEFSGSGSFEPPTTGAPASIEDQCRRELEEEIGLSNLDLKSLRPLALAFDNILHLVDILVLVDVHESAVSRLTGAPARAEYSELKWLAAEDIAELTPLSGLAKSICDNIQLFER